MKRLLLIVSLFFSVLSLFAGGTAESSGDDSRQDVFVSILPQTYLVEKIGGERVSVEVMVPPGKNPATYEPTPRQVSALGAADVFFTIGVAFEDAFLPVIESNLPGLPVIAGDGGITKRTIEDHDHGDEEEGHDHEEEGPDQEEEEGHEAPDPHIWMDPLLMKQQAQTIRDALIELDPEGESIYTTGYAAAAEELDSLHGHLTEVLAPHRGESLFVYHPAFGYFADRYGLTQVSIETGGKEPTPAQLEAIIEHALEEHIQIIFVQPEFPVKSAQAVAKAIGGTVIPVTPLRSDYIEGMEELAQAILEGGAHE